MKSNIFLLFIVSALLLLAAGCCKVYCPDKSLNLRLIHFTAAEADTILFTGYNANGQFNQQTDSFYYYNSNLPGSDTMYFQAVFAGFDVTKDWKIKLDGANREYRVTGIKVTTQKCSCGFTNYGKYGTISSYAVNGAAKTGSYVELVK